MHCLVPLLDETDSFVYLNSLLSLRQLAHFCFFVNVGKLRENESLATFLRFAITSFAADEGTGGTLTWRRKAMMGELLLLVLRMTRSSMSSTSSHSAPSSSSSSPFPSSSGRLSARPPLPSLLAVRAQLVALKTACLHIARERVITTTADSIDRLIPNQDETTIKIDLRESMTISISEQKVSNSQNRQFLFKYNF